MYNRIETKLERLKRRLESKIQSGAPYPDACANERDAYLAELLREGKAAETITGFVEDFLVVTQHQTLERLERGCDPIDVQKDYQAALRFREYLRQILVLAKQKKERGHNIEL